MVNQEGLFELSSYSWVGILEFLDLISENSKLTQNDILYSKCFWKLKLRIEVLDEIVKKESLISNTLELFNINEPLLSEEKKTNEEIVIYEFDLIKLFDIFNNNENGEKIKKILYSMWLEICSKHVKERNEVNLMKVREEKKHTNINLSNRAKVKSNNSIIDIVDILS